MKLKDFHLARREGLLFARAIFESNSTEQIQRGIINALINAETEFSKSRDGQIFWDYERKEFIIK